MNRIVLSAALVCLLGTAAPAAAQWVRVESPHFVVFGEAGEARTREYAAEFERFRDAILRVVPGAAPRPAVPALVFIFKDKETFAPYQPRFRGKAVEVSGYFASGPGLDVIMMPASNREAAMRTIFHEYSHLVTTSIARGLPPWLAEGLAEYYSTFQVRPNGRQAVLGGVIPSHLARLSGEEPLPLEQVIGAEQDSSLYNEGARRSMFYAQSWALVHMLLNGEPDRRPAFNRYVSLTHAGRPPLEAWREVFGGQKIADELRNYVRRRALRGYLFTFDREIAPATLVVTRPATAEVHAALGDLRLQLEPSTVRAHMQAAPAPATPYMQVLQGLLALEDGRHADAHALLAGGARASDDWLVQYRAAMGLERLAAATIGDLSRDAARAGEAALARVLAVKPDLPHAVALQGLLAGPGDAGVALLGRARTLAPARHHYAIWLAQFHASRGEFAAARQLLAPLLSPLLPAEIREYARTEMGRTVGMEEARRRALQQQSARNASGWSDAAGVAVPLYREVQPGEQRMEGTFERIECPRGRVILHVRAGDRVLRFTSGNFDAVEFLSYRSTPQPPIRCGQRPAGDHVYLTWRPAPARAALDGIAVAVEFLER